MDEDAEERDEKVEDEHRALHEQDEHTQDGYDDVELGHASKLVSTSLAHRRSQISSWVAYNELQINGTEIGR